MPPTRFFAATVHNLPLGKVEIGNLAGGATLDEIEPGPDPFAALLADD